MRKIPIISTYKKFFLKKKELFAKFIILFMLIFFFFVYCIDRNQALIEEQEDTLYGRGRHPIPLDYWGTIKIEIDYSENITIDRFFYTFNIWYAFNGSKLIPNIIWDEKLNVSAITFDHDNCTEYATLMNRTRTHLDAVHVLLLENFTVNGFTKNWGYCMFLSSWADMIVNYGDPKYTGVVVAYNQIMEDANDHWQVVKVICHEVGHALGCTHDQQNGIMKQGKIVPFFGFYFSLKSQIEMNPYNVWGIHKGFGVYA